MSKKHYNSISEMLYEKEYQRRYAICNLIVRISQQYLDWYEFRDTNLDMSECYLAIYNVLGEKYAWNLKSVINAINNNSEFRTTYLCGEKLTVEDIQNYRGHDGIIENILDTSKIKIK